MVNSIQASAVAPIQANVSEKYVVINTQNVITELEKRGFTLSNIKQQKNGKGRHVVRMRSAHEKTINGETMFPEIIISNSYDKKCAFSVEFGIFRLVCSNGLTIRVDGTAGSMYKTRHLGEPAKIAEEISLQFAGQIDKIWGVHERMNRTILTDDQKIDLAMQAAQIRWNRSFSKDEAKKLLKTNRTEDEGNEAWLIFNVLQENIIKGGIQLEGMKRTPKPVSNPIQNYQMNQDIFKAVYSMTLNNSYQLLESFN